MSASFLSVDMGNTRCKLRAWDLSTSGSARLVASADFPSDASLGTRVAQWLGTLQDVKAAALSAVGDRALEAELGSRLQTAFGAAFVRDLDPGLSIECRDAHSIGRDRLFAARGALELARSSAIVVDAGTALTVDALRASAADLAPRGVFLGGAIAAGPALLARSLATGGARLVEVEPLPDARALGRDTREALQAGIAIGFRGAARELVDAIAREAALEASPVVVTGGAARFLTTGSLFGARTMHLEPELVHRGLLAAWLDRARPRKD